MTKREQFLQENPTAASAFALLEKHEKANGKPCQDFTREEILTMYRDAGRSFAALRVYHTHFRGYVLAETGSMGAFGSIGASDIRTCVDKKARIITREEMNDVENRLLNATDRAVVELAWEGVNHWKAATSIRRGDVTSRHTLKVSDGREIPLTDRLYQYLMEAFSEGAYTIYSDPPRVYDLLPVDGVYKAKAIAKNPDSEWAKKKWHAQIISTVSEFANSHLLTETKFNALDLRNFGLYDKFQTIAARNRCTLFEAIINSEEGKAVLRRYGFPTSYRSAYSVWQTLTENYEIE